MRTYGRLREEIKRNYKTLSDFANTMGMDASTLSNKLNGKTGWKQAEMESVCNLLNIPLESVCEYFFYE